MRRLASLLFAVVLLGSACTASGGEAWTRQAQEDGIGRLALHCVTTFADDIEASELCNMLAVESFIAAQEAGACGPDEAVAAIENGIPAGTQDDADAYLRCTGAG